MTDTWTTSSANIFTNIFTGTFCKHLYEHFYELYCAAHSANPMQPPEPWSLTLCRQLEAAKAFLKVLIKCS